MDAYPSAKVVLTVRDEDSWLVSMNSALLTIPKSTSFPTSRIIILGPRRKGERRRREGDLESIMSM
jgi:hypothetical protein